MQSNGHYAVQGHFILVPIKNPYTTSYYSIIPTYILFCTVSKLLQVIGQLFAVFNTLIWGEPLNSGPRYLTSRN